MDGRWKLPFSKLSSPLSRGGAVTLSFLLALRGLSGGTCSDGDGVEGAGKEWVSVFKANVAHSQISVLPSGPRSCA